MAVLTNFLLVVVPADVVCQKNTEIVPHNGPLLLPHPLFFLLLDAVELELLTA
jgi:hypothetical protein